VIAVAAWQWPRSAPDGPAERNAAPGSSVSGVATAGDTASTTAAAGTAGTSNPSGAQAKHLDTFSPESGGSSLVAVPRQARGAVGPGGHPVSISCPSNQTGDQERSVTYLLQGRYLGLEAEVRPYYPEGADTRSATYVTALTGTLGRDGDLTITEAGKQQRATAQQPQQLSATIDGAEKLTLRVQCGDPTGTVILVGARLIPAD
jgi:hypothetical protein